MAKFIKFNIKDSSTPANEKAHLLDVDNIGDISWDGTNKVTIVLRSPAGGNSQAAGIAGRVATIEVSKASGALTNPTITNGSAAPDQAIVKAMTANPGGVVATAQLGKDESATPTQMYWHSWAVATDTTV
tara:strand:+ start:214 stop:603 length:390 start_codon:yes stop_codon:yes gene_type:complete